jgi:hypothetical protein
MIDIQGLFYVNPKTKDYLVRIGNLIFPFKSADEVLAYFLGLSKIKKPINQKMNNEPKIVCAGSSTKTTLYSFSLSIRYVSTYLRTYLRLSNYQKPNQNTPKHHIFKLSLIKNFVEVFSG